MGKMSEFHIILTGLVNDGADSGYYGNCLREYVIDEATSYYKIPVSLIQPFVDQYKLAECEEEIFND
jgi:hypothetical protein